MNQPAQQTAQQPTSFQDKMSQSFLSVTVTTRSPRRTATVPEAASIIANAKAANIKAVVSLMPEQLDKDVRSANRNALTKLAQLGWSLPTRGAKTEYLIALDEIDQAYEAVAEAKQAIDEHVSRATADWTAFVRTAMAEKGELELPATAFPYYNSDEYKAHFDITIRTQPLVASNLTATLPTGLSEMVVNQITQENNDFFVGVLDSIREAMSDQCLELESKIAGPQRITTRTFNKIMHTVKLAESTSMAACPVVNRVCSRIKQDYAGLQSNPGCLGPDTAANEDFVPDYAAKYKAMLGSMSSGLESAMVTPREK